MHPISELGQFKQTWALTEVESALGQPGLGCLQLSGVVWGQGSRWEERHGASAKSSEGLFPAGDWMVLSGWVQGPALPACYPQGTHWGGRASQDWKTGDQDCC